MKKANFELFISCQKSKTGNKYVALKVGLGYRNMPLTFDKAVISELTGVDIGTINQMNDEETIHVGAIILGD
jgi:hypothetical protein|nr:MAG TPA: hypothetical protein [Inoviridae sp.]